MPGDRPLQDEIEFARQLELLRGEWGGVHVDQDRPGYIIANNDRLTGVLVGRFAPLLAELINRAIERGGL